MKVQSTEINNLKMKDLNQLKNKYYLSSSNFILYLTILYSFIKNYNKIKSRIQDQMEQFVSRDIDIDQLNQSTLQNQSFQSQTIMEQSHLLNSQQDKKVSNKKSFSSFNQKFIYDNPHIKNCYQNVNLNETFGLNEVSKYQQFCQVNISVQQLMQQRQIINDFGNFSFISDKSSKIEFNQKFQHQIMLLQLDKPMQTNFLKNCLSKQQNPEKHIVRRFRPLSKRNLDFYKITNKIIGFYNYLIDFSYIPLNMADFNRFSWEKVIIFNFQNCGIGDEGFASLSNNIQKYPDIQKIFLAYNKIQNVSKNQLKKFVTINFLTVLNLQHNPLTNNSTEQIDQIRRSNQKIKFFNLSKPNQGKNLIFEQSNQGQSTSFQASQNNQIGKYELIPKSEKQEVLRVLSPSFSPENIRSSLNEFFRFINCSQLSDLLINLIQLLWQIKNDYSVVSIEWFSVKVGQALEEIFHKKVDLLFLFRQIRQIIDSPIKIDPDSPVPIQLKIFKYLFSELAISFISVIGLKKIENNLDEQFQIMKNFMTFCYETIFKNIFTICCKGPFGSDKQKEKFQQQKKQAWNRLIDGSVQFFRFIIKLQKKTEDKKNKNSPNQDLSSSFYNQTF